MKTAQEWYNSIDEMTDLTEEEREILRQHVPETVAAQSSTKSPTTTGFTKISECLKTVDLSEFDDIPRRTLSEQVADELAECSGCMGECLKTKNRWSLPYVNENLRVIWHESCTFGKQLEIKRMIRSSRIPERYAGKTFDDYEVDECNRDAVFFAKNVLDYDVGAYFYGNCGTGKTFLAAIVAQEFLKAGKTVIFVKVPSLLDDIKATFDGKSKGNEFELLDKLKSADLVVLDDFGMEKSTQWAGSTLCKILDMRYDSRSKTFVTSNLSIDELAKHLNQATDGVNLNGTRIADRLKEICKPILLQGESRRC